MRHNITRIEQTYGGIMKKDTNEKPNTLLADVMDKAAKTGKKGMDAASTVLAQTADKSKELAGELAKGAKALSEKAKEDSYNRRMKLYNPLFPEEYFGGEFFVPNIIQIVDDAVRRDIDVCKGAIGWRGKKKGVEVLFLYDEFVSKCGLQFVPKVECNDIYYVDPHDRKRFIQIDKIFEQTQEEKIAELENIAYCLGAKICTIEIEESEIKHDKKQVKAAGKQSLKVESLEASREESFNAELQSDSREKKYSWVGWVGCVALWGSIMFLSFYMAGADDRAAEKAKAEGKITAGNYEDYKDENYEAVVEQLETLGFENITTIDLDDAGVAIWKEDKVESVSIEGDTTFYDNDYYEPNVKIIIKYH